MLILVCHVVVLGGIDGWNYCFVAVDVVCCSTQMGINNAGIHGIVFRVGMWHILLLVKFFSQVVGMVLDGNHGMLNDGNTFS